MGRKNNSPAGTQKKIHIELDMKQAAALGVMFNEVLKQTGMKYMQVISDVSSQIQPQVPAPKKPNDNGAVHKKQ